MPNFVLSKKTSKKRSLSAVIVLLIIALSLANLVATNLLATEGVKLNYLSQQTAILIKENQQLANQLSQAKSLSQIETKAAKLGFIRVKNITILTPPDKMAQAAFQ